MSNFHPLEVVDRGSETQIQQGEMQILKVSRIKDNHVKGLSMVERLMI